METIGSYEAKTHWAAVMRQVMAGQEITITKRGIPVARLIPEPGQPALLQNTADELKALRKGICLDGNNWKDMRDEGRA